jgi:hypothetical protein
MDTTTATTAATTTYQIGSSAFASAPWLYNWTQEIKSRLKRVDFWTSGLPDAPAWAIKELTKDKGKGLVVCDNATGIVTVTRPPPEEEVSMT